jgi:hypothetical protein
VWFDHGTAGEDSCDAIFTELGNGEIRAELPASSSPNAYFLVNGFTVGDEGVAHTGSGGVPSDAAQDACLP